MTEQKGSGSMKKKKLERVKLSKQFLRDLLVPFQTMDEIVDIQVVNDQIVIDYRKGGVINTS